MINLLQRPRYCYLAIWLGCSALIAIALFMQYQMELIPCALCMTQRVFIIAIGIVALAAWIHQPSGKTAYAYPAVGIILAIIGGAFSSRHIWLQNLPEDLVPACGPSLSYLMETVPFMEAISVLLQGDGNCAKTSWSLLGLTIPGWTLVAFIGLCLMNIFILIRSAKTEKST